jgi:hypothetical protein
MQSYGFAALQGCLHEKKMAGSVKILKLNSQSYWAD